MGRFTISRSYRFSGVPVPKERGETRRLAGNVLVVRMHMLVM